MFPLSLLTVAPQNTGLSRKYTMEQGVAIEAASRYKLVGNKWGVVEVMGREQESGMPHRSSVEAQFKRVGNTRLQNSRIRQGKEWQRHTEVKRSERFRKSQETRTVVGLP